MARTRGTPLTIPTEDGANGSNSGDSHTGTGTDSSGATSGPDNASAGSGSVDGGNGGREEATTGSRDGRGNSDGHSGISGIDGVQGASRNSDDGSDGGSDSSNGNAAGFRITDDSGDIGSDGLDTGLTDYEEGPTVTSAGGRHKRNRCGCARCEGWRRTNGVAVQVDDTSNTAPSAVAFDSLGARTRKLGKNIRSETIGIVLKAAFELPTLMMAPEASMHWPLSPVEHKKLTADVDAVVDMLPKKLQTKGIEAAAKIFPPVALLLTAFMITMPRIQMSRIALARMKTNANPRHNVPPINTPQTDIIDINTRRDAATASTAVPTGGGNNDGANGNAGNTSPGDVSQFSSAFLDAAARY